MTTDYDTLFKEANEIQLFVEQPIEDDTNIIVETGTMLQVYIARTGKMLADAKYIYNAALSSEIVQTIKQTSNAPASTLNALVKTLCRKEQYLVDWLERLNRAATHQYEWCRTLISKQKAEMQQGLLYVEKNG